MKERCAVNAALFEFCPGEHEHYLGAHVCLPIYVYDMQSTF